MLKKGIVIFANSRAQLLNDCIVSVLEAKGSENWKKVLVCQRGFEDVEKIVDNYDVQFDTVIKINKQFESSLANINHNRILGTFHCFNILKCEYVLGIEEDTVISGDALSFIDQMFDLHKDKRAFRGINLGSHQPLTSQNQSKFSLLRFGLHGQGGVLTRKSWVKIFSEKLFEEISKEGWDSKFEYYLKSGFMVTPNASRILDRGWGGTHASSDPDSPYFERMAKSWVGCNNVIPVKYQKENEKHLWRIDSIVYNKRDSIFYCLRLNSIVLYFYKKLRKMHLKRFLVNK